jgi:xanthine dehydrogenase accessory factor
MTAAELRALALAWREQGRAATVVEVQAARGSVPREDGTRMLVTADAVLGTIGGGHLELQAIAQARRGFVGEQAIALGPTLGQCCGGLLTLRFMPLSAVSDWPLPAPRFRLQLYGAGHVGRAIARLLADLDCAVTWIDEREAEFPAEPSPPHIERRCVDGVEAEVATAAPGSCFLILTHRHDLDLAITREVLKRGDFAFCGLIGSATKRARFEHRLQAEGLDTQRLTCPIGLPGIAGKEPAVIAIGVLAQLLGMDSARA